MLGAVLEVGGVERWHGPAPGITAVEETRR